MSKWSRSTTDLSPPVPEIDPEAFIAATDQRLRVASLMAHALITRGTTRSIIIKDALELADQLIEATKNDA